MSAYKRGSVPEAPEITQPGEIPINTPLVLKRATRSTIEVDTSYGVRTATPVYAWTYDPAEDAVEFVGPVNVFWKSVQRQLAHGLTDMDTLLPCYVVAVGERERRELRSPSSEDVAARAVELVIERIAQDTANLADTEEDEPFIEPPAPF